MHSSNFHEKPIYVSNEKAIIKDEMKENGLIIRALIPYRSA